MTLPSSIIVAFLGGIFPALVWLWFWRREDRLHPEPRRLILFCFIAGMAAVPLVLPIEKFIYDKVASVYISFAAWAVVEEVFKFLAAYITVLTRKEVDEPIDSLIYLITAALGFAAMENAFYLLNPLLEGEVLASVVMGNMRFIGATLLHTIASATVGIFIAFSFYKGSVAKRIYTATGLILAIVLHTLFNLSIIFNNGTNNLIAFYSVWIAVIVLMLSFEKVKLIKSL
jgi:protease PrsW